MAHFVVYVTHQLWKDVRRQLEPLGSVIEWAEQRPVPRQELLTHVQTAHAIICTDDDRIDRQVIDAAPHLRVISTMSVGIDHIDLAAGLSPQYHRLSYPGCRQ